jgi:uncharacterized membrane protein YedE/YeeE
MGADEVMEIRAAAARYNASRAHLPTETSGWTAWIGLTLAALVLPLVLYVLSIGPAYVIAHERRAWFFPIRTVYRPLDRAIHEFGLEGILNGYVGWWHGLVGDPGWPHPEARTSPNLTVPLITIAFALSVFLVVKAVLRRKREPPP